MKIQEIRKKSAADLRKILHEQSEELREFRFAMSGGQKKNVRKGRELKHTIARIKTVLSELETETVDEKKM